MWEYNFKDSLCRWEILEPPQRQFFHALKVKEQFKTYFATYDEMSIPWCMMVSLSKIWNFPQIWVAWSFCRRPTGCSRQPSRLRQNLSPSRRIMLNAPSGEIWQIKSALTGPWNIISSSMQKKVQFLSDFVKYVSTCHIFFREHFPSGVQCLRIRVHSGTTDWLALKLLAVKLEKDEPMVSTKKSRRWNFFLSFHSGELYPHLRNQKIKYLI